MKAKLIQFHKQHARLQELSPEAQDRVRQRILSRITLEPREDTKTSGWAYDRHFHVFRFAYIVTAVFVTVIATGATAYVSADALPGDFLYPIKRTVENARFMLATSEDSKIKLQVRFTEKRLHELETIETTTPAQVTPPKPETKQEEQPKEEPKPKARAKQEVNKALEELQKTEHELRESGQTETANTALEAITNITKRVRLRLDFNNDSGKVEGTNTEQEEQETDDEQEEERQRRPWLRNRWNDDE